MFLLDSYLFQKLSMTKFWSIVPLTPFFSHKPCGFYCVTLKSTVVFMMGMLGSIGLTVPLRSKMEATASQEDPREELPRV